MINYDNKTISYVSCGIFSTKETWIHPNRTLDTYEIILMCNGTAYICEDNRKYKLVKDNVLILEPGHNHYGYMYSNDAVSFYWLHFRLTSDNKFIEKIKLILIENPYQLKTLFAQILNISNTYNCRGFYPDLLVAIILEELILQIHNSSISTTVLASRIKEWIRVNINSNITVKQIADEFGYNENYISKVFKNSYDIGLKQYINNLKVNQAQTLLSTTLYSVKQIANTLNFISENYFIKYFKYHTKMTPTQYRNIYINIHTNKN